MHIQQGQLPGQLENPGIINNPWGSRLHSSDTGWVVQGPLPNIITQFDRIYMRIELGSPHKVVYMDYQMIPTDDNNEQEYFDFLVRYGFNDKQLTIYEDRNGQVSIFLTCLLARYNALQTPIQRQIDA